MSIIDLSNGKQPFINDDSSVVVVQNGEIYNLGTGKSQTFNEVAKAVIDWNKKGEISYIKFPENLKGAYQSYTEADITSLRNAGYTEPFFNVQEGVIDYLSKLESWPKNEPN